MFGYLKKTWHDSSRYRLVIVAALLAFVIVKCIRIQDYMPLGRYQHWGIGIFVFGCGYLLQTLWSWRVLGVWARISYIATGLFFTSVGTVFYQNPWLDYKVAIQTAQNEELRGYLVIGYLLFSVVIAVIWARWIYEESKAKKGGKSPVEPVSTPSHSIE